MPEIKLGSLTPLLLAILTGSCGGVTSGGAEPAGDGGTPGVALEDFAGALVDATCSNGGHCCTNHGFAYDEAACIKQITVSADEIVALGKALNLKYDPNSAAECIAQRKADAKACGLNKDVIAAEISACRRVFTGSKKRGDACANDVECALLDGDTLICDPEALTASGQSQGICRGRGITGEPCGGSCPEHGGFCSSLGVGSKDAVLCWAQDGLYCDSKTSKCVELGAVGQACTEGTCALTAYCKSSVCAPKEGVGGNCDPEVADQPCQSGTYCDQNKYVCSAPKAEGESCAALNECQSGRCLYNKCVASEVAPYGNLCVPK